MAQLSIKAGDSLIVDGWNGDIVLKFEHIGGKHADLTVNMPEDVSVKQGKKPKRDTDIQCDLNELKEEIVSLISAVDAASGQKILTQLVSDLFYAQAQKRQKEERRVKQAEGIAQAKAAGVRFGPEPKPLPDHFDECYEALQDGRMTVTKAAQVCGLSRKGFYRAMERKKKMTNCAV